MIFDLDVLLERFAIICFDLNQDDVIDNDDVRYWVKDLKGTYHGDANLDGEFNSSDLVMVLFKQDNSKMASEDNSGWASGDWNADGDFTTSDLVLAFVDGGFGQGRRVAVDTVPEPNGFDSLDTRAAAPKTNGNSKAMAEFNSEYPHEVSSIHLKLRGMCVRLQIQ